MTADRRRYRGELVGRRGHAALPFRAVEGPMGDLSRGRAGGTEPKGPTRPVHIVKAVEIGVTVQHIVDQMG